MEIMLALNNYFSGDLVKFPHVHTRREDTQFKRAVLCGIQNDGKYCGAGSKIKHGALLQTFV